MAKSKKLDEKVDRKMGRREALLVLEARKKPQDQNDSKALAVVLWGQINVIVCSCRSGQEQQNALWSAA